MRVYTDIHAASQSSRWFSIPLGLVQRYYRLYQENRQAHREMLYWLGSGR